jgi:ribosomal protein S18 acetylase RimI-like enzyme
MFSIAVDDDYRRRGIGYELMCGLMSEAKHRGAHTAYLQVMLSKIPAMGLYDKIGFKEIYRYHYLKK